MESAMLALLLILVGLLTYMIFSPTSIIGPWLDKCCRKKDKWTGEDVGEQPFKIQEGTPFTPSLEETFDDPEVPNRPSKKSKKKKKTASNRNAGPVKRKRTYKRKGKK